MELQILSGQRSLPETELPVLSLAPNKKTIEQTSLLLSIAPSFTMAIPMLLGFYLMHRGRSGNASYLSMGLTMAIGSAVFGALWAGINCIRRQRKMRFAERLRKRSYRSYLAGYEEVLREKINCLENLMRNRFPDFPELIDLKRQKVYCFRELPDGELTIRLGIGEQEFEIPHEDQKGANGDILYRERQDLLLKYGRLKRIPVCLRLHPGSICCLHVSKSRHLTNLLRLLLIRTALTYHDGQVKILLLLRDPLMKKQFRHAPFLPHMMPEDEEIKMIREGRILLLFLEEGEKIPESLSAHPGLIRICFHTEDKRTDGPEQGTESVIVTERFAGLVTAEGKRIPVLFDRIGEKEAELVCRTLCRLKDLEREEGLPTVYPILSMFLREAEERFRASEDTQISPPSKKDAALRILENWKDSGVLHSLKVPIGILKDHSLMYLDAHDKRDGPHGLIAGMTGSGKSELLMTYILSLALHFPPWEVAFFLIDYKGAGMAASFEDLPHVIGSISNLSGKTIYRAFQSIRSENEYRQKLFLKNGVNHISDYHKKYRIGIAKEALPHIFLIVDEFAQLKAEEPDFMQELISLSRVGRSLGIHLLLCTQKPSGSVDAAIMTNANFQIALKLQDPMDSKEVLRHTDAADLTNPGRAILRVGNDEIYQTFQCAYALSPATEEERLVIPADAFGRIRTEPAHVQQSVNPESSMDRLLKEIGRAAAAYDRPVRRLWLKELPKVLEKEELMRRLSGTGETVEKAGKHAVLIGLWDDAKNVRQGPLRLDPDEGHHLICGLPGSGKSTLLCVFLEEFAKQKSRPEVYLFDFGGGMLTCLAEKLGLFGNCVGEETVMQTEEMLQRIREESRPTVVLIDGFGTMQSLCAHTVMADLQELIRTGMRKQIRFLISACGIGMTQMPQNLALHMAVTLCLRQQENYRYLEVLQGTDFKGDPQLPPGRGYVRKDGEIVEFMTRMYRGATE